MSILRVYYTNSECPEMELVPEEKYTEFASIWNGSLTTCSDRSSERVPEVLGDDLVLRTGQNLRTPQFYKHIFGRVSLRNVVAVAKYIKDKCSYSTVIRFYGSSYSYDDILPFLVAVEKKSGVDLKPRKKESRKVPCTCAVCGGHNTALRFDMPYCLDCKIYGELLEKGEQVGKYLYPEFQRDYLCIYYTPVTSLNINDFTEGQHVKFKTKSGKVKEGEVVEVVKRKSVIIIPYDTVLIKSEGKLLIVIGQWSINSAYSELLEENKDLVRGRRKGKIKFL